MIDEPARTAVRVVATDLDGTLFGPDHRMAARTVDVLQRVRERGIKVIAATGRSPVSAMELIGRLGVLDSLVCSNGSIVHDIGLDRAAHRFVIEPQHLIDMFEAFDGAVAGLSYCWEMDQHSAWDTGFDDIARDHEDLAAFAPGARPGVEASVTKVMVRHPDVYRQDLADLLTPHLPHPLTIGCSGVEFVEVTGIGVDKSRAIEHVITAWGFSSSHVMAFGDNHNDVQMLRWAGTGLAVDNAVDAAKSAADGVIGHHGDHAVAEHLERHLLG